MRFILASASASRRALLMAAGVPFLAKPADIDEVKLKDDLLAAGRPIEEIAGALAEAKALAVSRENPGALVLGADQALLFEGALISKCADMAGARALLKRLRGKTHHLSGGLALVRDGEVLWRHAVLATLAMRAFSDAFLEDYLEREGGDILACVGCYRLENLGAQLFDAIEGDYFSILGLSLLPLLAELRRQGIIAA
jgi:septum formation protein